MLAITKTQIKVIQKLCNYDQETKAAVVSNVTNGLTTSLHGIGFLDANKIIEHLGGSPHYYDNWARFDKNNQQHMYILSLCQTYGWRFKSDKYGIIADLKQLSEWLKKDKKCPVNKKLNMMNKQELSKIIVALEGMVEWKHKQTAE